MKNTGSPTKHRMTEHRMTEHRMTERQKTQHRMTECQMTKVKWLNVLYMVNPILDFHRRPYLYQFISSLAKHFYDQDISFYWIWKIFRNSFQLFRIFLKIWYLQNSLSLTTFKMVYCGRRRNKMYDSTGLLTVTVCDGARVKYKLMYVMVYF
jgi:hypothetical protein